MTAASPRDAPPQPASPSPSGAPADGTGDQPSGPGALVHSLALATWALFAGLGLLLVGAGLFGTLISVRAEIDGHGAVVIGVITAAYHAGLLVGSARSPRRWSASLTARSSASASSTRRSRV